MAEDDATMGAEPSRTSMPSTAASPDTVVLALRTKSAATSLVGV